jgi:hypothetical protein
MNAELSCCCCIKICATNSWPCWRRARFSEERRGLRYLCFYPPRIDYSSQICIKNTLAKASTLKNAYGILNFQIEINICWVKKIEMKNSANKSWAKADINSVVYCTRHVANCNQWLLPVANRIQLHVNAYTHSARLSLHKYKKLA